MMLKVLEVANAEVGYHEGASNITKYAAYLDGLNGFYNGKKNGYAWCDVFVDYCFVKAYGRALAQKLLCQPNDSAGAGCTYSAQYYQRAGRWSKTPQVGAQIFFGNASESTHTGLVYAVDANKVYTIEGNTSDMVAKREYWITYVDIYGYGLPDYSMVDSATETETDDVDYSGTYGDDADEVVYSTPSVPAVSAKTCTVTLPELREGATGGAVRAMQHLLLLRKFTVGNYGADGDFGVATLQAVKNFQTENGLEVDGICGTQTWSELLGGRK